LAQDLDQISSPDQLKTIAFFPLLNYSGQIEAFDAVTPAIERLLTDNEFNVVSTPDLRALLRRHRIRAVGSIDRESAALIASELNVQYLLLGSIDHYVDRDDPELIISLRLVESKSMHIRWARTLAAIGSGYGKVLKLGAIASMPELIERLVGDALSKLSVEIYEAATALRPNSKIVLLVPFDDLKPDSFGGAIVTAQLLTHLVNRQIRVIEPGVGQLLFRDFGRAPRGEIDLEMLRILSDSLAVDLVLTGTVDSLSLGQTELPGAVSELTLGARLIDARSGKILVTREHSHKNRNGGLLQGSRNAFAGRLLDQTLRAILDKLDINQRTKIAIH
jgi:TolB-like protein